MSASSLEVECRSRVGGGGFGGEMWVQRSGVFQWKSMSGLLFKECYLLLGIEREFLRLHAVKTSWRGKRQEIESKLRCQSGMARVVACAACLLGQSAVFVHVGRISVSHGIGQQLSGAVFTIPHLTLTPHPPPPPHPPSTCVRSTSTPLIIIHPTRSLDRLH